MATREEKDQRKTTALKKAAKAVETAVTTNTAKAVREALSDGLQAAALDDVQAFLVGILTLDGAPAVVLFESDVNAAISHWSQPWLREKVEGYAEDGVVVRFDVARMMRVGEVMLAAQEFASLWEIRPKKPEPPAPKAKPTAKKTTTKKTVAAKRTAPKKTAAKAKAKPSRPVKSNGAVARKTRQPKKVAARRSTRRARR